MSWAGRYGFLLLMLFGASANAIENTILIEADQAYDRNGRQKSELEFLWELDASIGADISLTSIIRTRIQGPTEFNSGHKQEGVSSLTQRHQIGDNVELELRELYADIPLANGNLRLGKQQIVWGQADGLKLLDVINPQDFREFILDDFEDSRLPVWTVNLELFLNQGDLQLVWIPDTSRHDIPPRGATYGLIAPFANLPKTLDFEIQPIVRPNNPLKDSTIGARYSTFQGGWDITANYLYRYNNFPVVRKTLTQQSVQLEPQYERTHTIGGSLSKAFGDYIFRSEAVFNSSVYFDTNDIQQDQGVAETREIGYVIGLDWSGMTDTLISVQGFQSVLLGDDRFVRDDVDNTLTFLARRNFWNESLTADLLWIYHLNDHDQLLRFKLGYQWSDEITVRLYADWFTGDENELFGQYDERDRIGLTLQYGF